MTQHFKDFFGWIWNVLSKEKGDKRKKDRKKERKTFYYLKIETIKNYRNNSQKIKRNKEREKKNGKKK